MSMLSLMWSNLFRHKVRTFLTLFSVLIAFLLFSLLRTVAGAFDAGVDLAGVDRLVSSPKYSIIDLLPITHVREIEAVDGVDAVTFMTWFGGIYQDPRNFFPKYPVRPREYFDMFPEYDISEEHLDAFERTRTGAVAPAQLAQQYGWQVGDKIPIEGDIWSMANGSRRWEFDLVGTYTWPGSDTPPSVFLFNYDFFDEARAQSASGLVGWFMVRVSDPDRAPEIASEIDTLFQNSQNPTRTATQAEFNRQFAEQIGDIGLMMTGILSAVFFTILLLTGNTMAQALRERIPELAVLKTLGFTDAKVSMLVLGEAMLLCVLGGALGIGLAVLMSGAIKPQVEQFIAPFELTGGTIALGLGIATLLGVVVGLIPALTARRLQIVDALRAR